MSLVRFPCHAGPLRAAALALSSAGVLLLLPACGGGGESKPTAATVEVSGKGRDVEVKAPETIKAAWFSWN